MDKLILASGSPRRKEILDRLGFDYELRPQDVDESFEGLPAEQEAVRLAEKKVQACINSTNSGPAATKYWIFGADTFVVLNRKFIGKPASRADAEKMLIMLSGATHEVITGLSLYIPETGSLASSVCSTEVRFAPMSEQEIEWYLDQNEWQGVAAAYRIQEKGALFIESISGSYSNVMGLPINAFYGILSSNNFNFRT